jgi:hypothetical protein
MLAGRQAALTWAEGRAVKPAKVRRNRRTGFLLSKFGVHLCIGRSSTTLVQFSP